MLVDDVRGRRVLVVGDVMLDHFVVGRVDRVSPEAPALVLSIEHRRSMLGGAGNVATNIASLGATATLVGVLGQDPAAANVSELLQKLGVVDATIREPASRTTEKTRYISDDRHLLRADWESLELPAGVTDAVADAIRNQVIGCDAIVVSDYVKGVVSHAVFEAAVASAAAHGIPLVADPKQRDFRLYAGADLLTPNRKELEFATGESCEDLPSCERAAKEVMDLTGAAVLLTRSEDGAALYRKGSKPWVAPVQPTAVRDVSGAGDTVAAVSAVALAAGADLVDASHAANMAATVAVGKSGTSSVTPDELNLALLQDPDTEALSGTLISTASARSTRTRWRSQGLVVGFTNGCFDLLHPGHVQLLSEARARCDRLIVGLNTDDSVRRLKGPDRPVQTELARAKVIGALQSVDTVVLFGQDTPVELIAALRPDVLFKGTDYTVETVVGADMVLAWGGRVELIDLVPDHSSTRLLAASRGHGPAQTPRVR